MSRQRRLHPTIESTTLCERPLVMGAGAVASNRCESLQHMRVAANSGPTELSPSVSVAAGHGVGRAVVLVLPGGQEVSRQAASPNGRGALRMLPFALDIGRRVRRHGVAVWRLHYRYRGWNAPEASPVADTRWALDEVRRRHGHVPVVLLGHSMGGRVAVNVADDPAVHHIVLLAPWLPADEPVAPVHGRHILILHGDRDRTTSLESAEAWAARAARTTGKVDVQRIPGGGHTMLRHARLWQELAAQGVIRALQDNGPMPT